VETRGEGQKVQTPKVHIGTDLCFACQGGLLESRQNLLGKVIERSTPGWRQRLKQT
jgi:hypothetical protein